MLNVLDALGTEERAYALLWALVGTHGHCNRAIITAASPGHTSRLAAANTWTWAPSTLEHPRHVLDPRTRAALTGLAPDLLHRALPHHLRPRRPAAGPPRPPP